MSNEARDYCDQGFGTTLDNRKMSRRFSDHRNVFFANVVCNSLDRVLDS
jgi:hypothetical protein